MDLAQPKLTANPELRADGAVFLTEEEITDGAYRRVVFQPVAREHLSVQACSFNGCIFPGFKLRRSHFTDVVFRNCDLSNADFSGSSFHRVEFEACKLVGANFSDATLQHVLFDHSKAEYANFFAGRMRFVRFADIQMRSAVFDDCKFESVGFCKCELALAELHNTRLQGISFTDSDIRGIRVGEVASPELKGVRVNRMQALDLARLLGLEIEEE